MLGLGGVALFGAGFGLGWLVHGEHAAPADLDAARAAVSAAAAGSEAGAASADGGLADGAATAAAGAPAGSRGSAGDAPGEPGSVAVVGADGPSGGAAAATGGGGAEGEGASAPASLDGGVRGRLDANAVRDVVREHRDQLGFCFAWQLHQRPDLGGRVVMEFVIGADGRVTEARVADDGLGDETVTRCFVGVTRRMEFPAPEGGGTVTVRYPFILSPGEPDDDE